MELKIPLRLAQGVIIGVKSITDLLMLLLFEHHRDVDQREVTLRVEMISKTLDIRRLTMHSVASRMMNGIKCSYGDLDFKATSMAIFDLPNSSHKSSYFTVEFSEGWTVACEDSDHVILDTDLIRRFESRSALLILLRAAGLCANPNKRGARKIPIKDAAYVGGYVSDSPSSLLNSVIYPGLDEFRNKVAEYDVSVNACRLKEGARWRYIDMSATRNDVVPISQFTPVVKIPKRLIPGRPAPKQPAPVVDNFARKTPSNHGRPEDTTRPINLTMDMDADAAFRAFGIDGADQAALERMMLVLGDVHETLKIRRDWLRDQNEQFDDASLKGLSTHEAQCVVRDWVVRNGPSEEGKEILPDYRDPVKATEIARRQINAGTYDSHHFDRMRRIMVRSGVWDDDE